MSDENRDDATDTEDPRSPWQRAADGAYVNLITGAMTAADPRSALRLKDDATKELSEPEVDKLVLREWGCERFITRLPKEATRKGFDLKLNGANVDDDATRQVLGLLEEVPVTGADDARGFMSALYKAKVLERQYGGAMLILWTDDGADPREPLDPDGDWNVVRLEVKSRWEIEDPAGTDELDTDPGSPNYGLPVVWRLMADSVTLQPVDVHHTRCFRFPGWSPERRDRPWDWGRSMLEVFEPAWQTYVHALNEAMAVMPRLSETRLAIKNFRALMASSSDEEKAGFRASMGDIAALRSGLRIFVHDAEEVLSDADIALDGADLMIQRAREHVAGAADTSIQSFFSLQQQGMSNNDESGERRDDAVTDDFQRSLKGPLDWLALAALRHLGIAGVDDWEWTPRPLRTETAGERSERQTKVATALDALDRIGAVHPIEIRNGLRAQGDWPIVFDAEHDAQLAEEAAMPDPQPPMPPGQGAPPEPPEDPANADPGDDPAAAA